MQPTKPSNISERVQHRRDQIMDLEATCKKQEQVDVLVEHYFANGVYARQMYLPKDVLVVGKIHNFENISVISKGKVRVATDTGVEVIEAPATFIGAAGVKRVILALEDTIWTTFHTSIDDDVAKIEQHHIAPSYDALRLLQEKNYDMASNSGSSYCGSLDSGEPSGCEEGK